MHNASFGSDQNAITIANQNGESISTDRQQCERFNHKIHLNAINFANLFQVYYNGVFDCARKMIRAEGVFALYKGIIPPIMVETPKRAVKFLTFEQLKPFFLFGHDKPTPLVRRVLSLCPSVTST